MFIIASMIAGTASFFIPPPWGAKNPSGIFIAIAWGLALSVVWGWLKMNPGSSPRKPVASR